MKHPRTRCPWCNANVALKTNNRIYKHRRVHPFGVGTWRYVICPGSNKRPDQHASQIQKDKEHGISTS